MFKANILQILYIGSFIVSVILWGRGIVLTAFSLLLNVSIQWLRKQDIYYNFAWIISMCIIIFYKELTLRIIAHEDKMKQLFRSKLQLVFIVTFQIVLSIYLLFINLGRYYSLDLTWYKITYLVSCILAFIAHGFAMKHSITISYLLEYEIYNNLLKEQLEKQLRHYKSYQKYTESFRAFKHDYKNMMASVKALMSVQKYEDAVKMIDSINNTMKNNVLIHKTYSNHILLDAILQDTANTCEEYGIRFSAAVRISKEIPISDIDMVRIFSNLINNAIEACTKVTVVTDRFLTITSSLGNENNWTNIEISNSYSGEFIMQDGKPKTIKEDKDNHGIGLAVVLEIIENCGGLMLVDANQSKKIFTVNLLLPK